MANNPQNIFTKMLYFGDLENHLNSFGCVLFLVNAGLCVILPVLYIIGLMSYLENTKYEPDKETFSSNYELLNVATVSNLAMMFNIAAFLGEKGTYAYKWTPKADLAFTYMLASNIASIIVAALFITIDYLRPIAILSAIMVGYQGIYHFEMVAEVESWGNFRRRGRNNGYTSLVEIICSVSTLVLALSLVFLTMNNPKNVNPQFYSQIRNVVIVIPILMIYYVINYIVNDLIQRRLEELYLEVSSNDNRNSMILSALLIIEAALFVYLQYARSSTLIWYTLCILAVASVIHCALYFTQMLRILCLEEEGKREKEQEERSVLEREEVLRVLKARREREAEEKQQQEALEAERKRRQHIINNIQKRLNQLAFKMINTLAIIPDNSLIQYRSSCMTWAKFNQLFDEKIREQINSGCDGEDTVTKFLVQLREIEQQIMI